MNSTSIALKSIGCGVAALALSATAQAQGLCLGVNCGAGDGLTGDGPNIYGTFADLAILDRNHFQNQYIQLFGPEDFPTRESCYQDCADDDTERREACEAVHGVPQEDEDPIVTDQRMVCLKHTRSQHAVCLQPVTIRRCDERFP